MTDGFGRKELVRLRNDGLALLSLVSEVGLLKLQTVKFSGGGQCRGSRERGDISTNGWTFRAHYPLHYGS
ncbi:hypothetical protein K443DRAFT_682312 [Laccaria amethystina LaAM-08-1]|jgi:hypothetical protein|uniref:Uncharacterized protein n=1 Tax=Laccaria amethystina LaAM-08-1 TaxID=1095629 RepID=A0A0C9WVH0_9AGAR|nr:hypothetical protein K443DRAFT_682312 [Laccaria amethystina LaAM-08-1]